MSDLKPELSKKNKYWIPKERYYELKHFCKQYDEWNKLLKDTSGFAISESVVKTYGKANDISDPVAVLAQKRELACKNVKLIRDICVKTDPELEYYIFHAVTEDNPFEFLQAVLEIPCSRDTFYDRYRKFFYLLDKART